MKSLHSSFFVCHPVLGKVQRNFGECWMGLDHFLSFVWLLGNIYVFHSLCFASFLVFFEFECRICVCYICRWVQCVYAFPMWTFVTACCSNFTYLSMHEADDVNFISHANRSCHIGPFFLIRHDWYACHNFHFTPSTGTAYIWFSWLQTFFYAIQLSFRFFFCVQSNPYHRKSFAVWVSHLMWKLNGWLTFMSGVIW